MTLPGVGHLPALEDPQAVGALLIGHLARPLPRRPPPGSTAVVDDVILGQAYPTAEAASVARVAALNAGLPV